MGQNIRGISLGEHIRDIRGTVSRTGLVLTQGLAVLIEFQFRVFCCLSKRECPRSVSAIVIIRAFGPEY